VSNPLSRWNQACNEGNWSSRSGRNVSLLSMQVRIRGSVAAIKIVVLAILLQPFRGVEARAREEAALETNHKWVIHVSPSSLVNGTPVMFDVTPPVALKSLSANWLGHTVVFDSTTSQKWLALAGISLETKPGTYALSLEGQREDGSSVRFERNITVGRAKYPIVQLTVSKQFTEPNPEQQKQIREDQELKRDIFSHTTPEREWSGRFESPVQAAISDVFGTRRVFNGVTKSVHQGLDFRVPPATPVSAINRGTVLLARPLYFEGNCVVIDHGQGLLSLYLHLSELKVKAGEQVERGEPIGLSGASGRATGPHLHIAVRWQGIYLDPAVLLSLPLP
jgi:murein DD-endopeptidase MepM/ murein hydrolase activator NlpD